MTKLYVVLEESWDEDNDGNLVTYPDRIRGIFKSREAAEIFQQDAEGKSIILGAEIVEVESDF